MNYKSTKSNKILILKIIFWIGIFLTISGIYGYVNLVEFPNSLPLFILTLMAPLGILIASFTKSLQNSH